MARLTQGFAANRLMPAAPKNFSPNSFSNTDTYPTANSVSPPETNEPLADTMIINPPKSQKAIGNLWQASTDPWGNSPDTQKREEAKNLSHQSSGQGRSSQPHLSGNQSDPWANSTPRAPVAGNMPGTQTDPWSAVPLDNLLNMPPSKTDPWASLPPHNLENKEEKSTPSPWIAQQASSSPQPEDATKAINSSDILDSSPDPLKTVTMLPTFSPDKTVPYNNLVPGQPAALATENGQVRPIIASGVPQTEVVDQQRPKSRRALLFAAIALVLIIIFSAVGVIGYKYVLPLILKPNSQISSGVPTPNPVQVPVTQNPIPDTSPAVPAPPAGMVLVPAGEYQLGCQGNFPDCVDGSKNLVGSLPSKVTLPAFYIDIYEVTNEEYAKFIQETGYTPPNNWRASKYPGNAKEPVLGVSLEDAKAYAKWAEKRLPTEEEWEAAASGKDHFLYPWGNEFNPAFANTADSNNNTVVAVDTMKDGASGVGAYHMCGNVWEWTASKVQLSEYAIDFFKINPAVDYYVIRGGSFKEKKPKFATTIYRFFDAADTKDKPIGFRTVKDVTAVVKDLPE